MSAIEGGSFGSGFAAGAVSSLISSGFQSIKNIGKDLRNAITIASGGLSGGISASIAGGNFWAGARQGLITSGLNHVAHSLQQKSDKQNPGKRKRKLLKRKLTVEQLRKEILKDGKLTLDEANAWYRRGKGQQLTIEASKIDLNFLNPSDWKIGDTRSIQTLVDSRDGRVYGNLTLTYEGNNRFAISPDTYDFEMHKYSGSIKSKSKTFFRNVATRIGNIQAGTGVKYKIYFTGLNTLNQEK